MRWVYVALSVVTFAVCAAVWAPAPYVLALARRTVAPGLLASKPHGTLIDGGAAALHVRHVTLWHVHWRLKPTALFAGRLALRVSADTAHGHGSTLLEINAFGRQTLRDTAVHTLLADIIAAANRGALPLQGRVNIQLADVNIVQGRITAARGIVKLQGLQWTLERPPLVLGSFQVRLKPLPKGGVEGVLKDMNAAIRLAGQLTLAGNAWTLRARLRPAAGASADIGQLLAVLGQRSPSGWYRIWERGRL